MYKSKKNAFVCDRFTVASNAYVSPSTSQRQPRLIHTSKKKVVVETKSGRTATKIKTIVTSNEIKKTTPVPEVENSAMRRSNRTTHPTSKKMESTQSPSRSLTNGTPRSTKSTTPVTPSSSSKNFQNNLLAELSKKSSNFSPDVVSDLEEILGSPIKMRETRTQSKPESANAKASKMVRVDYHGSDSDAKPATRSSKRLSNRIQPTQSVESPTIKTLKSSTRGAAKKTIPSDFQLGHSSEESQGSYDQIENNTAENIVMNIKQEKEVSFTMTDENSVFTCEMCSAVFNDRAQLLVHVPIHI